MEAKESVKIERENQTLATITFQNYFRMYKKLAGMTGTAETEAPGIRQDLQAGSHGHSHELRHCCGLRILTWSIAPRKRSISRRPMKFRNSHQTGQPVLVGTTSIEKSERLSDLLKKKGIKHVVLNAKYHEREAEIVAQAGRKGMVTIATNMAGRGTDILLGGNPEFMAKQECVKKGIAQPLRAAQGKIQIDVDDTKSTVWYYAAMSTWFPPSSGTKSSPATNSKPTESTTK